MSDSYKEKALADHQLTELFDNGIRSGYRLAKPESSALAFEVYFTGFGIFFQGDLDPVHLGGFGSKRYKSRAWFLERVSPDCLASNFLEKRLVTASVIGDMRCWIEKADDYGICEEELKSFEELIEELLTISEITLEEEHLNNLFYHYDLNSFSMLDEGLPGWDYDPNQMSWLVEMHKCFRRLYLEFKKELR